MSVAPIVIQFLAKGTPAVSQSIRNVADVVARAEKKATQDADREAKNRQKIADREARDRVRAMARADALQRQAQDRASRETERNARMAERAIEREARAKVRIESQAAREVERIQDRAHRNALRSIQQEERARDRSAMQWVRSQERAAQAAGRARSRVAQAMVGAGAMGVANGLRRAGGMAMNLATTAAQLGGGFSIADSVQQQLAAQRQAAMIATSTVGQNVSTREVLSAAQATGIRYGMDPTQVLGAIGKFKDLTGDTKRGMALAPEIAKLATAFGGDVTELSSNAANIAASSPNMSNADVMRMLRVQTMQGAAGAVELKDMAKYGARLTAGASLFGGDRADNIATMGALAQVARQHGGAATPAEAVMAAQRFATDIQKHAGDLEAHGIKVSDGHGTLRSAKDIMSDMLTKSGGDVTKLGQFGLGERGVRALTGFADIYRSAGGGRAGQAAVQQEFAKYTQGVSESDVTARANRRLADDDVKLERAFTQLRVAAGEQLLPVFLQMIPAIRDAIPLFVSAAKEGVPAFAELLKTLADFAKANEGIIRGIAAHPVGALVALEVTKSFAAAALPQLLKTLMTRAFAGGAGGAPSAVPGVAGGAGGGAGVGTAVAAGVAAGALTAAVTKPGVDALLEGQTSGQMQAGILTSAMTRGSAATRAQAFHDVNMMRERSGGAAGLAREAFDMASMPISTVYSAITGEKNVAAEDLKQTQRDREVLDTKGVQDAMRELATALAANTAATRESGGGRAPSNSGPGGAGRHEPIINR